MPTKNEIRETIGTASTPNGHGLMNGAAQSQLAAAKGLDENGAGRAAGQPGKASHIG